MNTKNNITGYCSRSSSSSWQGSTRRSGRSDRSLRASPGRSGGLSGSRSPHRNRRQGNGHRNNDPFHYNDTLPPNAVGSSRRPQPMSEDDEYHSSNEAPLESNYSHSNDRRTMKLRVRIEGAKDLVPDSRMTQSPPSTFVTVQTMYGRGKTPIIYSNANPPFNDEFIFEVRNPDTEEITVTVVAATGAGRKKLGQCALAVENLMRGMERRQWVALVRHPGTERAYECGMILVSLYSESFGTSIYSSPLKEKEFRDNLRALLRRDAPEELHRLEWYVGKCVEDYDGAYAALFEKYHKPHSEPAAFQLTINSVANLTMENGSPTTRETCYVKVTSSRSKKVTKMVPYHRRAFFNETFDMVLDNPKTDSISLAVYSANHKFGECLVSLNGLRPRVPKERTHDIVYAAGTGDACYCGTITIVLRPINYGTDSPVNDVEDKRRRTRLRNYLWKYLRDDLHRLDPIVASIDNMDAFMQTLVREYGPEPHPHMMRLRIQHFRRDIKEEQFKTYAVVVRMGPEIHQTAGVHFAQDFIFNDETMLPVSTAEKGELLFMVIDEADNNDVEIGRVVMSLKNVVRETVFQLPLQVYQDALTTDAKVVGTLFIEGILHGYGLKEEVVPLSKQKYFRQRVQALLSRYDPAQLHRVEYLLGENVQQEERLIKELTDTYGPETGSTPMRIRIVSIRDFIPVCQCYVKVYLDDASVLRTKDHYAAKLLMFDIGMKNEKMVSISNPLHSMLRFKVCEPRRLRSSRLLGVAEMSLRNMVRDEPNFCSLPIIDEERNEEIGVLGVEVQSPGFVKGTVTMYEGPNNGTAGGALEEVTRDVTSLMKKYRPQEVLHVQPLIAQFPSLREAHRELRKRFAPDLVEFTLYLHVDKITMIQESDKNALENGNISLSASFLKEEVRSRLKVAWADRIDTCKYFPEMRLDIAFPRGSESSPSAYPLEIAIYGTSMPAAQASAVLAKRNTISNRLILPEKELARVALSLRALLTKRVYRLGEAVTVPLVRSYRHTAMASGPLGAGGVEPPLIMGEMTLRITTPAFEKIPRRLRFSQTAMRRYHRGYVRYYEKRISSFYRAYDPSSLLDFHFRLYERDVASARWPLSLYDWLMALIKRYGPEPTINFGPPPKLPFDPEAEEEERRREGGRSTNFSLTDREGRRTPSRNHSRSRGLRESPHRSL
ncbi:uncharacterized protein Tco025E_05766 [Trypanosoma conorhini]|uniref:C2 domain-containing protein n=1 Tax=Trypanosoma conorhini TaxID=83891 RepID=A0A422PAF4_9TRYP|nr:uncharacterized protein Tco025E_05766 [Trypanosoma conorhini]RNF14694.1 hypothetical protein Tco025E_05766 [Trypanosoma conorhini]